MENETYTIELKDGTTFTNLMLNGNNYLSETPFDETKLTIGNFHDIKINNIPYTNMIARNYWHDTIDGLYHLIIDNLTPLELLQEEMEAKLDYLSMMTDVEL